MNAVCAQHFSEVDALPAPQSSQQLLTYAKELTRLYRAQLTELRAIEPPEDDATGYGRMLEQMQTTLGLYPDLQDAVVTGQQAAIESVLARANASNQQAGEAAVELGAERCAPGDGGRPLPAGEARRALLQEGGHALAEVSRPRRRRLELGLELELLLERRRGAWSNSRFVRPIPRVGAAA